MKKMSGNDARSGMSGKEDEGMEEILHAVKNVTIFILLFSIVSNLFSRSKYARYFRFVEGLIIILLVMMPLFSWFTGDVFLDDVLEQNVLETEKRFDEDELRMIGEKREEMLEREWTGEGENRDEER